MTPRSDTYKKAGVDIDAAETLIHQLKPLIEKTGRPEVLSRLGHFAGLFSVPNRFRHPVLCASTDGVGTKLKLALHAHRLDGLGQDLVAMSANDILCLGAEPLFFLDYFAAGKLEPLVAQPILKGIVASCRSIGCALLGGETAEMPSLYRKGDFDLAGFIVGIVERERIVDGSSIRPGDWLIGIASSGPHANGFSLIRKIVATRKLSLKKRYRPLTRALGEVLLEPTILYGNATLPLLSRYPIRGIAHITGGGFHNIPRILPERCGAEIDRDSWPVPAVFRLLQEWGRVPEHDMWRTFNMGIGLVLVTERGAAPELLKELPARGHQGWVIGEVKEAKGPRLTGL